MTETRTRIQVQLTPNTFVHAYGDDQARTEQLLEAYAGPERLERWRKEPAFEYAVQPYSGDRRGIDVQWVGRVKDGDQLPTVPAPLKVGGSAPAFAEQPPLPSKANAAD